MADLSTQSTPGKNNLQEELNSIIQKRGPYAAHNLKLGAGVYTKNDNVNFDHSKLNRIK